MKSGSSFGGIILSKDRVITLTLMSWLLVLTGAQGRAYAGSPAGLPGDQSLARSATAVTQKLGPQLTGRNCPGASYKDALTALAEGLGSEGKGLDGANLMGAFEGIYQNPDLLKRSCESKSLEEAKGNVLDVRSPYALKISIDGKTVGVDSRNISV